MLTSLSKPGQWLLDWINRVAEGTPVTSKTILGSAAVWYAIQTIAGDVAKMPLDVRVTLKGGKGSQVSKSHPAWKLLRDEPNGYQTADVFKEQIQAHALGWGNGRAAIIRDGQRPVELIPLMPDRTETVMVEGQKYHVTNPHEDDPINFSNTLEAVLRGENIPDDLVILHDRDVLHVIGFTQNGFSGLNVADVLKNSLGNILLGQKFTNNQLKKGFTGKLMLSAPQGVFPKEDEARKFLDGFRAKATIEGDGDTVALLREGITATVMQMNNTDAQFIEQQKFGRQDVMLVFGLQHIPGDNSSVSYNSLEQKMLAYLASCLDRWLVRWENQCDAKLRTIQEKAVGETYFKFNRGTWLQTDMATTADVLSKLVQAKLINRNEGREKLDMNPVDGGEEFENPAIQVNEPGSAAMAKLSEIVAVEAKRVIDGTQSENFQTWLDSFYAKWKTTLALVDGLDVSNYVSKRIESLVDVSGSAKSKSELRTLVSDFVVNWQRDVRSCFDVQT